MLGKMEAKVYQELFIAVLKSLGIIKPSKI